MRPADAVAGTPRAGPLARATLVTLGGAALLAVAALLAYALAAARVPQHRAALENLVHAETGLDVRFGELRLRWGWYGPEAVFHAVELYEPGRERALLTAPELVLGVDLWRMLRSGELQVGRITLVDPDIDVTDRPPPPGTQAVRAPGSASAGDMPSRWRGTRIDVEGGTLRTSLAGAPLAAGIRRIALRRAGADWSADALLTLPEALGATVHAALRLHGDASQAADLAGQLTLESRGLQVAGWRSLLDSAPGARYLPAAGSADVTAQLDLAHGGVMRAAGTVAAAALAWPAAGPGTGLALDELRADWHLARLAAGWHVAVEPLGLGTGSAGAALGIDAAADGGWVRGRVQRVPVAMLAGLARDLLPQLRLSGVELTGTVREGTFDWSAARPPEARLRTTAELDGLSIAPRGRALALAGLTARLRGAGASLEADLDASDARLTLAGDPAFALEPLAVRARLALTDNGHLWRVSTRGLEIRHADAHLAMSGALSGESSGAHPRIEARATLSGASVQLVRAALGAQALAALGAAGGLTAGRIEHAELVARGPLDEPLPWSGAQQQFAGALRLTGARLAGARGWPDLDGLDARVDWRGARVRVRVDGVAAAGLRLAAARGEWDARDASLTRLAGRLTVNAGDALAWLRDRPQLEPYAPGIGRIGLAGNALLDFDVRRAPAPSRAADTPRYATRLSVRLDDAQLRPVAGIPAVEALRGTLSLTDGRLQRSTLNGQWLGGPVALNVAERRERGATVLAISARGALKVREAVAAATGATAAADPLQGSAEWTADFRYLAGAHGERDSWRARADSTLSGVASSLPEPFAKASGAELPLHLELLGAGDTGELQVALGERLRSLLAVSRRGDLWRIERGAVNFAASAPVMPAVPVVRIEGSMSRLDLPGYLLLWRQLAASPAWPALRVELTAAELRAADRSFPDARVSAEASLGAGSLELESPGLDALVRWPAAVDVAHPVSAHLERLDLAQLAGSGAAPALIAALGSDVQLSIGAGDEVRGAVHCGDSACRASFNLATRDAAATLERIGLPAGLAAARAVASGEIAWPAQGSAALAGIRGRLHVELDDGVARSAPPGERPGSALGLLAVPGLITAMGLPQLPFTRLSADFTVADGQAVTSDLYLDGDTEILMRGRIGLLARDYDAQVWVLKGEQRLPAAVRRLGPGPRVAALWLSLRELFGGVNHERATLRLRGTWDDPMVTVSD